MMNAGDQQIEQYQHLRRQAHIHMRLLQIFALGLGVCLSVAFAEGSSGGWPWRLGALWFSFSALWTVTEVRDFELKLLLQTLPYDLLRIARD